MDNIKNIIDRYSRFSIIVHMHPDGDTIGTALGIYAILKKYRKIVEISSADRDIPIYLDFLPNFSKIKSKIDYNDSLVICCDGGSINLFGFNLKNRDILNIDHHKSNTNYGLFNIVDSNSASASQVAFRIFKEYFSLDRDCVTCFYTALVSDTQYFRTNSVTKEVFDVSSDMISYNIDISEVAYNLNRRKTLSSIRVLSKALNSLELHFNGRVSSMVITQKSIKETNAKYSDFFGIVEYGISLATVEVSILFIELGDKTRVSLRSKRDIDVSIIAINYGGGGHKNASGFEIEIHDIEIFLRKLIKQMEEMELIYEKKTKSL